MTKNTKQAPEVVAEVAAPEVVVNDAPALEVVTNTALEIFDNTDAPDENTVTAATATEVEVGAGLMRVDYV